MNQEEYKYKPFMWIVIVLGILAGLYSLANLPVNKLGWGYLLIAGVTLCICSRVIVQIPGCKGQISISDTFVLLSLLLFGVEAAVLLAGADALVSSLRVSKKKLNIAFNSAVFFGSTFLTGMTLRSLFGSMTDLTAQEMSPSFLLALSIMGLVQYIANSGLIAA